MSDDNEQGQPNPEAVGSFAVSVVLVIVLGILAAIGVPYVVKKRMVSQQNACINNLRIIDSGKEAGAMAYRLTDGDVIASVSVNEYVKGNTTPICPSGGSYTYRAIGIRPECSIETPTSHELP